jgi:hypothetical protein
MTEHEAQGTRPTTKTWGPFTGRQLTTIICVLVVTILLPVGAYAVSFSNVAITDPGGVNRAKVTAGGALQVGGNVVETPPANFVRIYGGASLQSCSVVYTVPAGKALILKAENTVVLRANNGTQPQVYTYRGGPSGCGGSADLLNTGAIDAGASDGSVAADFGAGIAVPSGSTIITSASDAAGWIHLWGYLVAASSVPAQPLTATAQPGVAPTASPRRGG